MQVERWRLNYTFKEADHYIIRIPIVEIRVRSDFQNKLHVNSHFNLFLHLCVDTYFISISMHDLRFVFSFPFSHTIPTLGRQSKQEYLFHTDSHKCKPLKEQRQNCFMMYQLTKLQITVFHLTNQSQSALNESLFVSPFVKFTILTDHCEKDRVVNLLKSYWNWVQSLFLFIGNYVLELKCFCQIKWLKVNQARL